MMPEKIKDLLCELSFARDEENFFTRTNQVRKIVSKLHRYGYFYNQATGRWSFKEDFCEKKES